ncbi:hypothetical protein J3F84DRAFT_15127 [Trichoderma pleuroticola]
MDMLLPLHRRGGPLSYRQTRRQKQLLGCHVRTKEDSRILPGPAAERVPRPASRWPGCPFLSAAVLASWKPLFGSRTLSRRLFLTVASKHSGKMRKNGITVRFFFCNDEYEYAVGCVDGDSQARNGGAYMKAIPHQAHSVCPSALSEAAVKVRCCTTWTPRTYTTVVQRPC